MRVRRTTSVTVQTTELLLVWRAPLSGGFDMTGLKQTISAYTQEVWNQHRVDAIDTYYARDYVHHDVSRPDVTSLADYKAWSKALQVGLPDIRVAIDDLIAEGDMAVKRWTASGTHTGELAGIAPTRRPVRFSGVSIYRFHDGRIAESWYVYDLFGLVQQLTAVTSGNERGTELLNSERSRAQLR